MVGRLVLLALVCIAIATAPAAVADDGDSCVWTSQNGSHVSAGYDLGRCAGGDEASPRRATTD